jgi:molybdopterin synthase sulfur carrier subunit
MPSKPADAAPDRPAGAVVARIPGLLRSYTDGMATVALADLTAGATLADALAGLDRRFPGLRFRIVDEQGGLRPHIKVFVDGSLVRDLAAPLPEAADLMLVGALSGG